MSSSSSSDMIILKSKDGAKFVVKRSDLVESENIKDMVDNGRFIVEKYKSSDYFADYFADDFIDDDDDDDDSEKPTGDRIPVKAENTQQQDELVASTKVIEMNIVCSYWASVDTEPFRVESNSQVIEMNIVCSDSVFFDAEPFRVVQEAYKYDDGSMEVEGNRENIEMKIVCSDGISIDAEPFKRESRVVQDAYKYNNGSTKVESNSEIIKAVKLFCEKRANIQDLYAHSEIIFRQMLAKFYSEFCESNRDNALHLMIAAFDLGIKSLIDLMMEDVDDMFSKMTSADAFYKIFKVNLNGQNDRKDKYEFMKDDIEDKKFGWAFESNDKSVNIVCSDGKYIDPKYFKRESRVVQLCYNQNYSFGSTKIIIDKDNNKQIAATEAHDKSVGT
ncbi:uncharacterized protein [Rutidosis leptorrhynchoides]|uniref:uncharacterized protein n=1 Tax=Rutidosis leptorrhynchoides TaxID=125765 RepID=UPI003A99D5E0